MASVERYTERSSEKKRGPYDTTPLTQSKSTEAAESFEACDIETFGGVETLKYSLEKGLCERITKIFGE